MAVGFDGGVVVLKLDRDARPGQAVASYLMRAHAFRYHRMKEINIRQCHDIVNSHTDLAWASKAIGPRRTAFDEWRLDRKSVV